MVKGQRSKVKVKVIKRQNLTACWQSVLSFCLQDMFSCCCCQLCTHKFVLGVYCAAVGMPLASTVSVSQAGDQEGRWYSVHGVRKSLVSSALQNGSRYFQRLIVSNQGRSDGGYIGIYTPKINNRFVYVWDINTCLKLQWLVKTYTPPQIKFLATPLYQTKLFFKVTLVRKLFIMKKNSCVNEG